MGARIMRSIVSMEFVRGRLDSPETVIVDCRFVLGDPEAGRKSYEEDHIPGAVYLDLEQDLSGPKRSHSGRHPLPDPGLLARKLGSVGIDPSKRVIAYDNQGGAMASRLWWLLQYLGHKEVYIMDGGYSRWKSAGCPVTDRTPTPQPAIFNAVIQDDMVVGMEEVRNRLGDGGMALLDSREEPRYKGLTEPIDPVAGHIPGAVNYFWKEGLDSEGCWKSAELQKGRFEAVDPGKQIIVYCGSGVTACPNIIALKEAGFPNVKLYAGSWSDWISYPENPVAKG
jgi:thiosulfate/3-mercaptopyruvate sulfurtransferase